MTSTSSIKLNCPNICKPNAGSDLKGETPLEGGNAKVNRKWPYCFQYHGYEHMGFECPMKFINVIVYKHEQAPEWQEHDASMNLLEIMVFQVSMMLICMMRKLHSPFIYVPSYILAVPKQEKEDWRHTIILQTLVQFRIKRRSLLLLEAAI